MANQVTFKILRTNVVGRQPTSLDSGELAINTVDGLLFYSNDSGNIRFFGDSDHIAQKLEDRLAVFKSGLDSAEVLDLVPFTIGYETNTITHRTLNDYLTIEGGLVTVANNDAFGVLQRDIYDNMEPQGRIELVDFGSLT